MLIASCVCVPGKVHQRFQVNNVMNQERTASASNISAQSGNKEMISTTKTKPW